MRRKRTYNIRLIRATWPYTVQEIAALLKVHKNAVTRWLKQGLRANRDKRPYLIRGDELVRFLSARQQKRKRRCTLVEFYCFKCREPRRAYLGIADVVFESPSLLRVRALCEVCETMVNKVQAARNLEKIRACFHVQQLVGLHLTECGLPSVRSDLETQR